MDYYIRQIRDEGDIITAGAELDTAFFASKPSDFTFSEKFEGSNDDPRIKGIHQLHAQRAANRI